METIVYKVSGMTCGGCTASMEKLLLAEPGIEAASASHEGNKIEVTLDAAKVADARISEIVDKAGFEYGGKLEG